MISSFFPNRTPARPFVGVAGWRLVASDGSLHASYSALQTASKTQWPGPVTEFPLGVPALIIRTTDSTGLADGAPILVKTNTTAVPTGVHDIDFMVSGNGQQFAPPGGVKLIWVYSATAGDYVSLTGCF